ncbi:MAG: PAS domain-containing protein, partial [Solirubrobacteraceae bacterium]|nr:PAS domain-containing protein [Patulibacter sp.]
MSESIEFLPPGTPVDLDTCAREPIHLPGSVQPHGALLVARASDGVVTQVSANVGDILGAPVDDVLGRPLRELVGEDAAARFTGETARAADHGPVRPSRVELVGLPFDAHGFRPDDRLVAVELEPGSGEPGSDLTA